MGTAKINFADVESSSFEPVPEGRYEVIVERVEVRESKSSDNNYLNWELRITDEDYEDQRLWMITSLSPKALFRLKDIYVALGVIEGDEEDFEIEWDDDVDITPKEGPLVTNPDCEGMAAIARVHNEVYEGKEQNRVDELTSTEDDAEEAKPAPKSKAKSNGKSRSTSKSAAKGGRKRALR
jgi:hypothetical protein